MNKEAFWRGFYKAASKSSGDIDPAAWIHFIHSDVKDPAQLKHLLSTVKNHQKYRADLIKGVVGDDRYDLTLGDSSNFRDDALSAFKEKYDSPDVHAGGTQGYMHLNPKKHYNSQTVSVVDHRKSDEYVEKERMKARENMSMLKRLFSSGPNLEQMLQSDPGLEERVQKLMSNHYFSVAAPGADLPQLKKLLNETPGRNTTSILKG